MMKLTNCGIDSEQTHFGRSIADPSLALNSEFDNCGQQNRNYRYPRHVSQRSPQLRQRCRVSAPNPTDSLVESRLAFFRGSKQTQAIAKLHLDNIRRSLERRLQVARKSGDSYLVNLLENECKQIDVG